MKNVGRLLLLAIALFFISRDAKSQQNPSFSQYMFNNLYFNPAYSGVEGVSKISLLYRDQWLGYQPTTINEGGAPKTTLFTFNVPILRFRSGVGFYVVDDRLGPQNNIEIQASYAYHLVIGEAKMSFGLKAGIYSQTIDFSQYDPIDDNDPLILEGKESQIRPDMGVGVHYQAEKYYAGIGLQHILKSEFDFGSDSLRNPLENHLVATGGYHYQLNYDVVLTPSFIFNSDFNSVSFDLSLLAKYQDNLYGGLGYRQSEAVIGLIGYSFLKDNALSIGYALDYVISAQDAKQPTSHEIQLSYTLPVVTGGGKKVVRTPRFRH